MIQKTLHISTDCSEGATNITGEIVKIVKESSVTTGMVNIFVQGSTTALAIQENWDDAIPYKTLRLLEKLVGKKPENKLEETAEEAEFSHLKANFLRSSETIPVVAGKLGLSTWQNIFLYEFDGPRKNRVVIVTVYECN